MSRKCGRRKSCSAIYVKGFFACTRRSWIGSAEGYERIHGRQTSHDLLNALLNDPQFAWLRPIRS